MFKREFKINLKAVILWTVIVVAMYILVFAIYPSLITEDTKLMLDEMMKTMPQEMLSSFNMDIVGIETAYGWFQTEGFIFLVLIGGAYSAILGGTILLKEENDKTIEFLYSKPISKTKIVGSKIICGLINIFLFTIIVTLINGFALSGIEDFLWREFLMISILPILLYYMMFFIMLFISTFFKKTKKTMGIGIAFVFIEYIMQIIGNMGEKVEIIKNMSLFEFASSRYIILNNAIDMKYVFIGIGIIIVMIIGTFVRYNKKEFLV